jgi:hypothetical protein
MLRWFITSTGNRRNLQNRKQYLIKNTKFLTKTLYYYEYRKQSFSDAKQNRKRKNC